MAEVEEILEQGEAFVEEVEGKIKMYFDESVEGLVILQMTITTSLIIIIIIIIIEDMVVDNKETMHRHQTMVSVTLLCNT